MKIFLDTANVEEIKRGASTGCVYGVTTNPTIISRENKPLKQCIMDISTIDPGLVILIEAISAESVKMIEEARELVKLAPNVVIKLPMTSEGLSATKILSKEGISIAVTLVFSLNQAIAASCAGADYVAPFVGRLDDMNSDGLGLVQSIKHTFKTQGVNTKVIAASIRTPQSVSQLFAAGCDIVTMPGNILESMLKHPLTEAGLRKFEEDWGKVPV
jgi:transaldolase